MFFLATRLICAASGFVYPVYASYKAIKFSDPDKLERWLMFWCVMGVMSVGEMTVEWVVNWLPLYYEAKTLVILWLTLPQIQGSSFVYLKYLEPFLQEHENDIDTAVSEAKAKAKAAGLGYLRQLWDHVKEFIVGDLSNPPQQASLNAASAPTPPTQHVQHQPAMANALEPAIASSQAWNMATALLRTYAGPAIAAGSAVMHPMQSNAAPSNQRGKLRSERLRTSSLPQPGIAYSSARSEGSSRDMRQRKADADANTLGLQEFPSASPSRSSSELDLPSIHPLARRSPSHSNITPSEAQSLAYSMVGGSYEEIDRIEANQSPKKAGASLPKAKTPDGATDAAGTPASRSSWFAWGGNGTPRSKPATSAGAQHVKAE